MMSYGVVTHNRPRQLVDRIDAIRRHYSVAKIFVVDNSSLEVQQINVLNLSQFANVEIHHALHNSRFAAYNKIFELVDTEWFGLRTDDDLFDEHIVQDTLQKHSEKEIIVHNYTYCKQPRPLETYERPLESVLFRSAIVKKHGPMSTNDPSADWDYLRRLMSENKVALEECCIMDKVAH